MKKVFLYSLILMLIVTIVGCSNSKISSPPSKETKIATNDKLTAKSALRMAITHYNNVDKGKLDYKYPLSMTVGKTASKKVPVGGPVGNTTKLDLTNNVKSSGKNYIVTLIENYNYVVNGTKAISYWKYEASPNGLKLLDKNENGNLINEVKIKSNLS